MHRLASSLCGLCALCALALNPIRVAAQSTFDPAARAAAVAPFLDDQAIAIAHVDLEQIDAAAIVKLLGEVVPPGEAQSAAQQLAQLEQALKLVKTTFRAGGISELYAVLSLSHTPHAPVIVVAPLAAGADAAQAAETLKQLTRLPAAETIGKAAVAGTPEVLARLKTLKPALRPDLVKAFALAGDTTAQLIVAPTDDTRRVIREMLPRLPEEIGGGSGAVVADGIRWAVLSVSAPPKLSLNLTVQSKDENTAAALRGMALGAIQRLREAARHQEAQLDERQREGVAAAVRLVTPRVKGDQLVISHVQDDADVRTLLAALVPAVQAARTAAGRAQSTNNLKQLAIAMHMFHDNYAHLPPQAIRSKDGKPLLSWRVAILPYVGQQPLYNEFHLDEPWDSEHNKKLIEKMPAMLASPHLGDALQAKGMTSYLVPLSKAPPALSVVAADDPKKPIANGKNEMVFDLPQGATFARMTDGSSNTIMILEVHPKSAVVWTKPEDLIVDATDPLQALVSQPNDGFSAAFCDGSVHFIATTIDPKTLLNLLQMNDGNVVGEF
jgi:hypothetical protein